MRSIILAFAALISCCCASAQTKPSGPPSPTVVTSAVDGIFGAFQRYPLVGISDDHGSANASDKKSCDAMRSKAEAVWPMPALAGPAGGGAPDAAILACARSSAWDGKTVHHAVLLLGPTEALTYAPKLPDNYLDPAYRQEAARRYRAKLGRDLNISSSSFPIRRAAYRDLDAPGWGEAMDVMFGRYDANRDGLVSEQEYRHIDAQ